MSNRGPPAATAGTWARTVSPRFGRSLQANTAPCWRTRISISTSCAAPSPRL